MKKKRKEEKNKLYLYNFYLYVSFAHHSIVPTPSNRPPAIIRLSVLVVPHNHTSNTQYRVKLIECSAKDDKNVTELFRAIVSLSRVLNTHDTDENESGLKRRSSAYFSATSKGWLCVRVHISYAMFVWCVLFFILAAFFGYLFSFFLRSFFCCCRCYLCHCHHYCYRCCW